MPAPLIPIILGGLALLFVAGSASAAPRGGGPGGGNNIDSYTDKNKVVWSIRPLVGSLNGQNWQGRAPSGSYPAYEASGLAATLAAPTRSALLAAIDGFAGANAAAPISTNGGGGGTPGGYWTPFPAGSGGAGVSWLPVCPPAGTPDTEVSGLPPQVQVPVTVALATATDPDKLEGLANQLDYCGLHKAAATVRARSSILRAGGGGSVVPGNNMGGGGGGGNTNVVPIPIPGTELPETPPGLPYGGKVASDPSEQWKRTIKPGDSPIALAIQVFGPDGENAKAPDGRYRWVELIQYNNAKTGKAVVGSPASPYAGFGGTPYNFKSLVAGEEVYVPQSWNGWISTEGYKKGAPDPWPVAA